MIKCVLKEFTGFKRQDCSYTCSERKKKDNQCIGYLRVNQVKWATFAQINLSCVCVTSGSVTLRRKAPQTLKSSLAIISATLKKDLLSQSNLSTSQTTDCCHLKPFRDPLNTQAVWTPGHKKLIMLISDEHISQKSDLWSVF